jgi:hypothetical protein
MSMSNKQKANIAVSIAKSYCNDFIIYKMPRKYWRSRHSNVPTDLEFDFVMIKHLSVEVSRTITTDTKTITKTKLITPYAYYYLHDKDEIEIAEFVNHIKQKYPKYDFITINYSKEETREVSIIKKKHKKSKSKQKQKQKLKQKLKSKQKQKQKQKKHKNSTITLWEPNKITIKMSNNTRTDNVDIKFGILAL